MTVSRVLMLIAALSLGTAATALAQGRGGAQRPPKVTTAQGPKTAAKAPKTTTGRPADRGGKPDVTAKADRPAKADKADTPRGDNANGARADANDARGTSGQADLTIAERISRNPQQRDRLAAMLPAGVTLEQAAAGFRNEGQFIAAVNASKNQNIPFAQLKTEMTGPNALSLGEAIQKLRPAASTTTNP